MKKRYKWHKRRGRGQRVNNIIQCFNKANIAIKLAKIMYDENNKKGLCDPNIQMLVVKNIGTF
jgi:hypothetical protein